jgi:hypothetical protein
LAGLLGGGEWPVDDPPRVLGVKVLATGDPDDPDDLHLTIEAVLRHKKAGSG